MTHPSEWSKEKNSDWSDSSVASYYYPKLKLSNNIMDVIGNRSSVNMEYLASCNIKTLIILPDIDNSNLDASIDIDDTINKFRNLPLDFLSTRARNPNKLTVTLSTGDQLFSRKKIDSEEQWEEVSGDPFPLTNEMAQITGLELKEANYRVILAPETELNQESLYWSYLPTEKKAGYNLQIHADFYLSNSRRTVPFGSSAGNKPQDYNMKLLDKIGATITGKLWLRPEVANRNDFWNLIAPNNCVCQDLKWRACKTLLQKDYFIKLVTLGFTKSKEIEWKSSRYSDFFKFIEQLCDYAYKHQNLMPSGIRSRKQMKETLLQWIHESKANVLPIIENMEAEENYIVEKALALVIRTKGQQKQEFILYQRRSSSINLPDTVRKRGTWTTTFLPDGMDSGKPGMYGMTEFNRVEILKNLYTDGDISDHESEELLKYVIKITNEISDVGGGRSIWDRSKDGDFGRMWGLLHRDNSMREAWNSISKLKIPTLSGQWHRAEVVTDPPLYLINAKDDEPSWGWPILDRDKVKSLCSAALDKFTENDFAFLFGIPQGPPLSYSKDSKQYVISDWEHIIDGIDYSGTVSSAILEGWYHSYHPFFIVPEHERESTYLPIINSLQNDPWLCDDGFEERDITLSLPENCAFQSLAPSAVWLLRKGQGFQKINSLPHMILEKGLSTPIWVNDLNIKQVEDSENFIEKIVNAIKSISDNQILLTQWAKDTEELYTRLIKSLGDMRREINDDFVLPLLIRDYKESGKRGKLRWSVHGDSVWFDNGDSTQALGAFPEYKLWVVRRNYATIGEKMGVKTFRPIITPEWKDEEPETNLSDQVKSIVRQLLPDVLASTEIMGIVELNIEQLMARWSSLDFTHKVDV
ncbi:MAG: hypothetical protein H8D23_36565, partial [Candidatus Brocadiales bacterium]|nr:hypothetical protein [Candidatus Brocadiales bacterium]